MGERVVTETAEEEGGASEGLGEVVVQLGSVKENGFKFISTQPRNPDQRL